jgi:hypothetical protein
MRFLLAASALVLAAIGLVAFAWVGCSYGCGGTGSAVTYDPPTKCIDLTVMPPPCGDSRVSLLGKNGCDATLILPVGDAAPGFPISEGGSIAFIPPTSYETTTSDSVQHWVLPSMLGDAGLTISFTFAPAN